MNDKSWNCVCKMSNFIEILIFFKVKEINFELPTISMNDLCVHEGIIFKYNNTFKIKNVLFNSRIDLPLRETPIQKGKKKKEVLFEY